MDRLKVFLGVHSVVSEVSSWKALDAYFAMLIDEAYVRLKTYKHGDTKVFDELATIRTLENLRQLPDIAKASISNTRKDMNERDK